MYHIPNDKRCVASANLIYEGLEKSLKKKPFEQITVSDIQKSSYVARSTFYRNFDNITDILSWKCDESFKEALKDFSPKDFLNELSMIDRYFSYWMKHSHILEELISINRTDIISSCHLKNAMSLAKRYGKLPGLNEIETKYFLSLRTSITISVLTTWVKGGKKETISEIDAIIKKVLLSRI